MDEKDSVETIEKFIEGDEATHDGATNAFESNQNSKRKKKMKEQ